MKYLLFSLLISCPHIATANGFMNGSCRTMMGWYSPELESAAQRSRDEALAREQRAARDLIEPFVGQTIRLSDMNGYFPSGVILDIGRGQMSYAVETHGETIYPVIVKLGNHGSHTYWMTIENLKLRTSK